MFAGAWGVEPIETYVPDDENWDRVMPEWLIGRRDLVVGRLVANPSPCGALIASTQKVHSFCGLGARQTATDANDQVRALAPRERRSQIPC